VVATAAEGQGISRATGYKWVRRYRTEGAPGLADRSSRPHRSPRATPAAEVSRILAARSEWRWGVRPDRVDDRADVVHASFKIWKLARPI
jgi:transposase